MPSPSLCSRKSVLTSRLAWAAATLVLAGLPSLSSAQVDQISPDHWAYKAVQNMMNKALVGYPDGAFRGSRPMSRYEFAAATYQLWRSVDSSISDLQKKVESLISQPKGSQSNSEEELRQALSSLGAKLSSTEASQNELAKVLSEFEKELASLGVDVDGLKKEIDGLKERTAKLEGRKPQVLLSGEVTLHALAGWSSSNRPGLTTSRFITGVGEGAYAGQPVGATRDIQVHHEAAFTLQSQPDAAVQFKGVFTVGNLLGSYGGYSPRQGGTLATGPDEIAVDTAQVEWGFDRARGKGVITLGRYGHKVSPYLFQRPDTTDLFSNSRWDDGAYRIDGAKLTMNWPDAEFTVFGGRLGNDRGINGTPLTAPMMNIVNTLPIPANEVLGASLRMHLNPRASVKGGYMYLESDQETPAPSKINRMISLGGEMNLDFGGLKVDAGVAKPIQKRSATTVIDNENESMFAQGTVLLGSAKVTGGYRHVETFSTNIGDWGRFGTIQNPTGFKSIFGKVFVPLGPLDLMAGYEDAEGMGLAGSAGIGKKDKLRSLLVSASWSLNDVWSLLTSYESARWEFAAGTDPYQSWTTLSARAAWSDTSFAFGTQLSDSDSKGRAFLPAFGGSGRFKGGVLFSQVSLKF